MKKGSRVKLTGRTLETAMALSGEKTASGGVWVVKQTTPDPAFGVVPEGYTMKLFWVNPKDVVPA